jgi:hypothetical protein
MVGEMTMSAPDDADGDLYRALLDIEAASGLLLDYVRGGTMATFDQLDYARWCAEHARIDWLAEALTRHVAEARAAHERIGY